VAGSTVGWLSFSRFPFRSTSVWKIFSTSSLTTDHFLCFQQNSSIMGRSYNDHGIKVTNFTYFVLFNYKVGDISKDVANGL
jgi:hypothetical protein